MKRLLQLALLAVAAYGLYELLDHYLWQGSKAGRKNRVRPLPQPEPAGTRVGGAVLTGSAAGGGGRPDDDEDAGYHSATVVGRGVVSPRTDA